MAKRLKTLTIRGATAKPKRKKYSRKSVGTKAKLKTDTVKAVVIKPRRKVETSDALLFPSGRPIRKR
jgi:hypothetical protein